MEWKDKKIYNIEKSDKITYFSFRKKFVITFTLYKIIIRFIYFLIINKKFKLFYFNIHQNLVLKQCSFSFVTSFYILFKTNIYLNREKKEEMQDMNTYE